MTEPFSELLGCKTLGVRLEVLTKPMCPQFHVDRTGIRFLCTYRGPGTEWLSESTADGSYLGTGLAPQSDNCSGLIRDPAGIGCANSFDVILHKGSLWQGRPGWGHSSLAATAPQRAASPRWARQLRATGQITFSNWLRNSSKRRFPSRDAWIAWHHRSK